MPYLQTLFIFWFHKDLFGLQQFPYLFIRFFSLSFFFTLKCIFVTFFILSTFLLNYKASLILYLILLVFYSIHIYLTAIVSGNSKGFTLIYPYKINWFPDWLQRYCIARLRYVTLLLFVYVYLVLFVVPFTKYTLIFLF